MVIFAIEKPIELKALYGINIYLLFVIKILSHFLCCRQRKFQTSKSSDLKMHYFLLV